MTTLNIRHYYLLACCVFWVGVLAMLVGWFDGQVAISYVASSSIAPYLIMLTSIIIVTVLVLTFLRRYLFAKLGASVLFIKLYYFAYILIVLSAIAPAVNGPLGSIHGVVSIGAAIVSTILFYLFARNKAIKNSVRIYIIISTIVATSLLFLSSTMAAELTGILLGQVSVLAITYLGLKEDRH